MELSEEPVLADRKQLFPADVPREGEDPAHRLVCCSRGLRVLLCDEERDIVVYACEPCSQNTGSPMPSNLRCLECGRPIRTTRRLCPRPGDPSAHWSFRQEPVPAQPSLFREEGVP